jgi:tRNA nucleotidyltransferase (CCA-adding enzyme)
MVAAARRIARREKRSLYLVGGPVRDLYLGRPLLDVDVVVESDALDFARRLSETLGVPARVHERFGTATLAMPGGGHLDLARSRRETYEKPGALPSIEPAPIEEDLGRRDFTINAMALELAPGTRLLDPFGGKADLEKRVVRMLHAGSPHDDPTRAFRAARYGNRLGFRIEARTRKWIAEASRRGVFDAVSGDRLRREVRLLFSEENRAGAVRLLCRLGIEREIDPALPREASVLRRLRRAERTADRHPGKTGWLLYLLAWTAGLEAADLERLSRRLSLAGEEARILRAWPDVLRTLRFEGRGATASAILARGVSGDEMAAAAATLTGDAAGRLDRALAVLETRLAIAGRDLLAAGVPAGASIGRALEATLSARRDGKISRRQELAYALAAARREAS